MTKILWKWFGLSRLKSLLDMLPANGKKTIIGLLVIGLSVAASIFPESRDVIMATVEYLKANFEASPLLTSGTVVTAVGALHKLLKVLEILVTQLEKEEAKEG